MKTLIKSITYDELEKNKDGYVTFLYENLDRFRDDKKSIAKCLNYVLNPHGGGHVFEAIDTETNELMGLTIILNTNMAGFIPENFLVYIAVHKKFRGGGIGGKLLDHAKKNVSGEICLHVESDNPAKSLYLRSGFQHRYDEMRYYPNGNS